MNEKPLPGSILDGQGGAPESSLEPTTETESFAPSDHGPEPDGHADDPGPPGVEGTDGIDENDMPRYSKNQVAAMLSQLKQVKLAEIAKTEQQVAVHQEVSALRQQKIAEHLAEKRSQNEFIKILTSKGRFQVSVSDLSGEIKQEGKKVLMKRKASGFGSDWIELAFKNKLAAEVAFEQMATQIREFGKTSAPSRKGKK